MQHLTEYEDGVTFTINSKVYHSGNDLEVDTSLNTYIREHANLKGTKYMCKEGGCGACIVTLTYTHPNKGHDVTIAANSCLVPVLACHGMGITTIEGIGNKIKGYNRIQKALADFNGTQCGYCSPGMVMNMYSLLIQNPGITMEKVEQSFGGNTCRCTGYRPILDAFKSLTINATPELKDKLIDIEDLSNLCTLHGSECKEDCKNCPKRQRHDSDDYSTMFLETAMAPKTFQLKLRGEHRSWYRVSTVEHIFQLFDYIGEVRYMLVAGNTAKGVYEEPQPTVYIDISEVAELRSYQIYADHIQLGANVTLTETINIFERASTQNYLMFGYTKKLAEHIERVANVPVRNRGTLAGNLMIKWTHREFPSDIFLILATCGALITTRDRTGTVNTLPIISLLEYDMYKRVILSVTVPALSSNHYTFRSFKIMPRHQNAHALVNAGFLFRFQKTNDKCIVEEIPTIVFGNISPNFTYAHETQNYLYGQDLFNSTVLRNAILTLSRELQPNPNPPETSPAYREQCAIGLFYKFILKVNGSRANSKYVSGGDDLIRPLSSGKQDFPISSKELPVHLPIHNITGQIQCAGEAEYIDDIPCIPGQLQGALVITEKARCKIVSIDPSKALSEPGVIAFFSAKDIPGVNSSTIVDNFFNYEEEELFCSGNVLYAGQQVGIIVAETRDLAEKAAKLVQIKYSNYTKPLLTAKEVLASGDTSRVRFMEKIDPTGTPGTIAQKITGELELEGQYHYTMEVQTCLSVPVEDGLNVYPATQWMHNTQAVIARVLNMPLNSINVEVRRVGGAFGVKFSKSLIISASCSLAAIKLQRPVRMALPLITNMKAIGKRCAVFSKYEVGVDKAGKIQNLKLDLYEDMGSAYGDYVIFLTRDGIKNGYDFSNWAVKFYMIKTDVVSSAWFRAPGTVEGIATIETIMDHIAKVCKLDPLDVRIVNLAADTKSMVVDTIREALTTSDYNKRLDYVKNYNSMNRWRKRGISVIPMKFGIIFLPGFHSTVCIYYNDGTVTVSTGGIEIGQGLNTKVAQVCAYALGIDLSLIKIKPASTLISPNNNVTGGSVTSEIVSYSTLRACEELNKRLQPIREKLTNPTWQEVVLAAFQAQVDLKASHMYTYSDPIPKPYAVYGATVLEVEVDILTGQSQILRVDLVEDAGESLNPNIDMGQIEGAFVQGLGYYSSEELIYDKNTGELLTNRSWMKLIDARLSLNRYGTIESGQPHSNVLVWTDLKNYWPPGAQDIPIDFRVTIKKNSSNPVGVLRSKATGEPAICMGFVLTKAIREAIISARKDAGLPDNWFQFYPPTTVEKTCLTGGTTTDQFKL